MAPASSAAVNGVRGGNGVGWAAAGAAAWTGGRGTGGDCLPAACTGPCESKAVAEARISAGSKAATAHMIRPASMLMTIRSPEIVERFGVLFRSLLKAHDGPGPQANKADSRELQSLPAQF